MDVSRIAGEKRISGNIHHAVRYDHLLENFTIPQSEAVDGRHAVFYDYLFQAVAVHKDLRLQLFYASRHRNLRDSAALKGGKS